MATTTTSNTFLQRLIGAAALDIAIYEEVEADRGATGQALAVVVLSSLAGGLGARGLGGTSPSNIAFISIVALMAWAAWALVTYHVGARPPPHLRACFPASLFRRSRSPRCGCSWRWSPVRQALDYTSTARAIAVCVFGWALALALAVGIGLVFGPSVS